ncbi:EEV glycoprotein [Bovine papular stomatitis virus]
MGCCKIPNRQSIKSLKKASCPVATLVTVLSLITSLGAIARYTNFFLREACEEGWMPVKEVCVVNTHQKTDVTTAHEICRYINGQTPAIPNRALLRGISSLTGERHFWMSHHNGYSSVYELSPRGADQPYWDVRYNKNKHKCLMSADGEIHNICDFNATVICTRPMHNN